MKKQQKISGQNKRYILYAGGAHSRPAHGGGRDRAPGQLHGRGAREPALCQQGEDGHRVRVLLPRGGGGGGRGVPRHARRQGDQVTGSFKGNFSYVAKKFVVEE